MNIDKTDSFAGIKRKVGRKLKPTDPDYVAPDGGWGWFVAFACGLSNLSIFSMFQQFGLVFTDKFHELGITHTQTTTIININLALTSCVGLFNGPIYRKFSFRQVAFFGSSLVVSSLLIVVWCKSFWGYFVFYSLLFGSAVGLTQSANALALNTYFKEKRSVATGLSWGTTGIGPIIWPYVITILMNFYGTAGTILLFAGFSGHAIMCSLLLQPVHWHTKHREETEVPLMPIHPKLRTVVRSNSLPIYRNVLDEIAVDSQPHDCTDTSCRSMIAGTGDNTTLAKNIKHWLNDRQNRYHKSEISFIKKDNFTSGTIFKFSQNFTKKESGETIPETGLFRKIITFFDLEILKDLVFLNIIFGMISVYYVECNFSVLTPVILKEFNFEKYQVATYMSIVGATDVMVRFSIPFVANKIKWNNRIYFILGTTLTTIGRIVLIHSQNFSISIFVAVLVGFGKGLGIIYIALLIPSHVSLQKLPAALGIYLAMFGIFLMLMAPVAGWIRDITHSYVTTLHILHIFIYMAAISWFIEYWIKKRKLQAKINEVLS